MKELLERFNLWLLWHLGNQCVVTHNKLVRAYRRKLHLRKWKYGYTFNEDGTRKMRARHLIGTSEVYFVMWKAGEQGHKENCWLRMGSRWIFRFKSDEDISKRGLR